METAANDLDREHAHGGRHYASTASARQAVKDEVRRLVGDVEELVRCLGDAADPEIARLRSKVQAAISGVQQAIASRAERVQQRAEDTLAAGDSYVREQPWQAVGLAALIGVAVGFLVSRR
jgi:ElaB/YqjD/DUF883 family membrane-anchored ribosome-binding protein